MKSDQHARNPSTSTIYTPRLHLVTSALQNDVISSVRERSPTGEESQHFAIAATRAVASPLALWHLLSLDAPTVATLWTYFVAVCAGISMPWQSPAAMFAAVWMLYVADRLLDARPVLGEAATQQLEERHHFHHRHRTVFLTGVSLAAIILASLLHTLPSATLHLYVLLATLLGAWLLLIHARPLPGIESHRLPKELAVGLFFPAAVCIPTVAAAPQLRLALLVPALCFAAICTLNCLFVYAWEHPVPQRGAHATTRWATRHLPALAATAIAACCAMALHPCQPHGLIYLLLACAASTAALLILHIRRNLIAPIHLRALADFCLLTPLLILPFTTIRR